MPRYIVVLIALLMFQCGAPKTQEETSEDSTAEATAGTDFAGDAPIERGDIAAKDLTGTHELWDSTDVFTVTNSGDTTIFDYKTFSIYRAPKPDEAGQSIYLHQGARQIELSGESTWFKGAIGRFVLLDEGTGSYRTLIVFDSETGERLTNAYVDGPHFSGSAIWFHDRVEIADESKRPACSEELKAIGYGLGYAERLAADLAGFRIVRTGQYRCQYFE